MHNPPKVHPPDRTLLRSLASRIYKNGAFSKFIGGIVGVEVGNAPYKIGDRCSLPLSGDSTDDRSRTVFQICPDVEFRIDIFNQSRA